MTTIEEMAMAALRGDIGAAMALADSLREQKEEGLITVEPVKRVKFDTGRYHVIAYMSDEMTKAEAVVDAAAFRGSVEDWIREGGVLVVQGFTRIELYELE